MTVRVDDILAMLVGRSGAPSTMGAQLDRVRLGLSSTPDPFQAREDAESRMLEQAAILRCMDHFASRQDVRAKNLPELKTLEKLHRHTRIPRGALAFAVLRAYQERSTASKERGLVEVYGYVKSIAPHLATCEELDLLTAFRSNTAKRARSLSAELVADSLLALQSHVAIWNQTSRG